MSKELYRVDGVLWHENNNYGFGVEALCPNDKVKFRVDAAYATRELICDDCQCVYKLPRVFAYEAEFVCNKIEAQKLSGYKVIDFDGIAIPLAAAEDSSDDRYFVIAKLVETKVGKRMVVYAGEKGTSGKVQIFVEPDIKRLAFDQKDTHPSDVFMKLEAQFDDGTTHTIIKAKKS